MKIGHIIIALAAAALAASCSIGTIDESQAPLVYREFTATLDPSTRTGLDANLKVLWDQSGESITIVDEQGIGYKLNQQSVSSDRRTATFSGAVPASGCILAVYPSQDNIDYDDGALTITLPHEQAPVEGSFATGANITISKVSGNNLSFKNICGILSFTVNADNVTSISLSAEEQSGGALTGAAVVGFEGENPYALSDSQSGKKHVELSGAIARGKRYIAIVYPGTYGNLKLIFTDSKGRTASFDRSTPITVQRSKIVNISPITINESDWNDGSPAGGSAMLTYSELDNPAQYLKSYGNPTTYTNSYGTWNICAYNTGSAYQLNGGKVAYLGTPEFDGTITSVTIKNVADRTGKFIICTTPGDSNPPSSGTKEVSFSGACTVSADVSSLKANKLYIRSSVMSHITELTVEWGASGPVVPTVTTLPADNISMADATLYASFKGIPTTPAPVAAFFRYGTSSSNLNQVVYDNETLLSSNSGNFSAALVGLSEATTYYYQAVITLGNGNDVEGSVLSFTTRSAQQASSNGYLDCYEVPAVATTGVLTAGNETNGRGYKWYRFYTTNSNRRVVTHTFNDGGRQFRNYTVMVDKDRKAPIWDAFIMHKTVFFDSDLGRGSWTTDPSIPSDWQNSETLGNYHKGHLVASNYRQNYSSARNQTFYYTNQAPQYQTKFNDGIWNQMENRIVTVAPSGRDTLYVVAGVLYEGKFVNGKFVQGEPEYISGVPIPSHFYTCLMLCSFDNGGTISGASGCAYLFNNQPYSDGKYNDHKVTIDSVEERAGLDLFHNVPDQFENTAESQTAAIL